MLSLLQYITALLMVFLVSWHLIVRIPQLHGVETFVETMSPDIIYREVSSFGILLVALALVVVFHGINGLRGLLLELRGGTMWGIFVNAIAVIAFIILLLIGIYTVMGVTPPG
ncbi:MAG: succinate:quinone oxidoreductase [Thermoprotei archaeon]|nr:succinate:quinone oxidoreductase [Thermoprotei archaeon]